MEYSEAKEKFLQSWGALGSSWGINRTMAQIHALLLISESPQSADDIMESLQISRGNANMNIRALIDWGLVYKELKTGDRKEYFVAEKDLWEVVKKIIIQRKRKELEPLLKVLDELSDINSQGSDAQNFSSVIREIKLFSTKADALLANLSKSNSNIIAGTFFNAIK